MRSSSRHRVCPTRTTMHEPAGKRKRGSSSNVHQRLFDRQVDAALPRTFVKRSSQERFSHFSKRLSLDLRKHFSPFLTGRHRVLELCAAEGLILGLAENGICAAFDIQTGTLKCILNRDHNEVVRSLFHNKRNATLIAVSVFAADQYSCLRCRSTPFTSLRVGKCTPAIDLFPRESLRWPGFVEFDDVNGKVLTFSADCSTYKVWSMVDPSIVLYEFKEDSVATGISEIKISPGIMLLVCTQPHDLLSACIRPRHLGDQDLAGDHVARVPSPAISHHLPMCMHLTSALRDQDLAGDHVARVPSSQGQRVQSPRDLPCTQCMHPAPPIYRCAIVPRTASTCRYDC